MRNKKIAAVFVMAVFHGVTGVWLAKSLKDLKETF